MKTEQEQNELGQLLWDILGREYIDKYCEDKNGNLVGVSSISVDGIAEELVKAGYGDVSEYKAEIEQLKAKNKVLGDGVAKAFTNGFNTGREQVEKDIRRAKIDVLNKLKEKLGDYEDHCLEMHDWQGQTAICECEEYIDELIKEIEK